MRDALLHAAIDGVRTVRASYYAENREDAEGFQPYTHQAVEEQNAAAWRKAAMAYEFTHAPFSGFDYIRYYVGLLCVRGAEARHPLAFTCDVEPSSQTPRLRPDLLTFPAPAHSAGGAGSHADPSGSGPCAAAAPGPAAET